MPSFDSFKLVFPKTNRKWARLILIHSAAILITLMTNGTAKAITFDCPTDVGICSDRSLWLSGSIEAGDYDKVVEELKQRGPIIDIVILSKLEGGNVLEAMKIGRLLRKLSLSTALGWAPIDHMKSPYIFYPDGAGSTSEEIAGENKQNALCLSSCIYIWLGGKYRFGYAFLGVHKPTATPKSGVTITASQQEEAESYIREEVSRYVEEMNAPSDLMNIMWNTASEQIKLLPIQYVISSLEQYPTSEADSSCNAPDFRQMKFVRSEDLKTLAAFNICLSRATSHDRQQAWQSLNSAQ